MILVTGGTGLVGAHLLYHLINNGENVRAIYRTEDKIEALKKVFSYYPGKQELISKIEWFKADITNVPSMIPAFVGIEKVYHCAALISFNSKDYIEMRKINIHGTAIIVNLSIASKIKKICFVSSISSIGHSLNGDLITEENEWNKEADNSGYSITKYGAEMEIWRASQEGVEVVVVNPGVILGSGFWDSGSGKLFSNIHKGFRYYTEGITGFISVQDVVKSMILLMNSKIKNERFILISQNKSFKEVLFLIADALGKKRPSKKVNPWQINILRILSILVSKFTGKPPILTKQSAINAHSVSKYTSEKIIKLTSFKFTKIDEVINGICKDFKS